MARKTILFKTVLNSHLLQYKHVLKCFPELGPKTVNILQNNFGTLMLQGRKQSHVIMRQEGTFLEAGNNCPITPHYRLSCTFL